MTQFITYTNPSKPWPYVNSSGLGTPCPTLGAGWSKTGPQIDAVVGQVTSTGAQCTYTLPDGDANENIIKQFMSMSANTSMLGCPSSGKCVSGWELDGPNFQNILLPHFCKLYPNASYCDSNNNNTNTTVSFFKKWWVILLIVLIALAILIAAIYILKYRK